MNKIVWIFLLGSSLYASDFYYEYGKKVTIVKSLEGRDGSDIKYYENSLGKKIGVTDEIIFQCKDGENCMDILKKYNISNMQKLSEKIYLIKVPKDKDIFQLSQKLYEDDSIKFAHPNFIKKRTRR